MERSHSLPSRGHSDVAWDGMGNPWYSDKARTECLLAANRPMDLPTDTGDDGKPIQNSTSGMGSQPSMQFGVTGKGRGSSMAGVPDVEPRKPTVQQQLKSEGVMPGESGEKTMGSVGNPKDDGVKSGDSLQRALGRWDSGSVKATEFGAAWRSGESQAFAWKVSCKSWFRG